MSAITSRQLVAHLLENEGISPEELSTYLGLRERAVRNRIYQANSALSGIARIAYQRALGGYVIEVEDQELFDKWLASDCTPDLVSLVPSTPDERRIYLAQDLLSRQGWITIDELASMLFVSRSTVSSDLHCVEATLQRFGLQIERKPHHGIRVSGTEMAQRLCLASVIVESRLGAQEGDSIVMPDELNRITNVLDEVLERSNFKVNPLTHRNLVVHIAIALMRIRQQSYVPLGVQGLEQIHSTTEYEVAHEVAKAIGRAFDLHLPDEEIGYIAIHLASKHLVEQQEPGCESLVVGEEAWAAAGEMIDVVWRAFRFDFHDDLELRMNLACHLVPLAVRLRYHMAIENPLLTDIKARYPLAYLMAVDASLVLARRYSAMPSEDEIGFLALSLALAIERRKSDHPKKRVLAVCASGSGSSRLLSWQVKQAFGDFVASVDTCDVAEVARRDLRGVDYIFTTVPLPISVNVPVLQISVFLDEEERAGVTNILRAKREQTSAEAYFSPSLFFEHLAFDTRDEAISFLCERITECDQLPEEFFELVMRREELAPTTYGNLVALPHPYEAVGTRTLVCVGLLDHEVDWAGHPVRAIFLVSISRDSARDLEAFYRSMVQLLTNRSAITRLLDAMSYQALTNELKGL